MTWAQDDTAGIREVDLDTIEARLAVTIRQYRLRRHMSQADLARALGVRHSAVSRWELREASVSADALLRLAQVFEVPVGALFGDQPELAPREPAERSRLLEFLKLAGTIQDATSRNALLMVSRVLIRHRRGQEPPAVEAHNGPTASPGTGPGLSAGRIERVVRQASR